MKYVYLLPYNYKNRIQRFEVKKWTKKEAILENETGKKIRITPSEFERYKNTPQECIGVELSRNRMRLNYTKKELEKITNDIKLLEEMDRYISIKTRYQDRAEA